jgi:hypothetical protein
MAKVASGFLIVKTFDRYYREYIEQRESIKGALPKGQIYSVPRSGVGPEAVSKKYRGIDRDPLFAWNSKDEEYFRGTGLVVEPIPRELTAHLAIGELEKEQKADYDFIFDREEVRRILGLIEAPRERELIWVGEIDSNPVRPSDCVLLGYEPTMFWGHHFSAISDCMCFPCWHGHDDEGTLFLPYHERLNEHALFNTPQDAREYIDFYLSHDWTETGDYVIAEIRLVEV